MNFKRTIPCSRANSDQHRTIYRNERSDRQTDGRFDPRQDQRDKYMGAKINIDDIVDYIEKNKKFINNPQVEKLDMNDVHIEQGQGLDSLQYNKTTNLDSLPANLQSIFGSLEFIRAGALVNVQVPADTDVSYVSSLIMLMVPDFTQMTDTEKIEYVQTFIRKIHRESRENFTKFGYEKLGWNLKEFMNNVKNFVIGKDLLRYVADFLNVNIFMLDYEMDALVYIGEKTFCRYKKNFLLLKIRDNRFEPVFTRDEMFIDCKSFIIKKLMKSRFLVERMDCDYNNEKEENNFVIGEEDLEKYFEHIADKNDKREGDKNDQKESKKQDNKREDKNNKTKVSVDQSSDDLNGFDQEDVDGIIDTDNPDGGHLFDASLSDCENDNSDSDEDQSEAKHINIKNHRGSQPTKKQKDHSESDEKPKKKPSSKLSKEKKDKQQVSESMTAIQLKDMAKNLGIDITYTKNGKKTPKTKPMLVAEINAI